MLGRLKFCALVVANMLVALLGTAILETAIGGAFTPHFVAAAVLKEWILSIACAAFIGYGVCRIWRTDAARWAWTLPTAWFGIGVILSFRNEPLWVQFSGSGCGNGVGSVECRTFFVFTIPFLRGLAYSFGAYISSLLPRGKEASPSASSTSSAA